MARMGSISSGGRGGRAGMSRVGTTRGVIVPRGGAGFTGTGAGSPTQTWGGRRHRQPQPIQPFFVGQPWWGTDYGPSWDPQPNTSNVNIFVGDDRLRDDDGTDDNDDLSTSMQASVTATGDVTFTIGMPGMVALSPVRTYINPFQYTMQGVVNTYDTGATVTVTAESMPPVPPGNLVISVPMLVTSWDWMRLAVGGGAAFLLYTLVEGHH